MHLPPEVERLVPQLLGRVAGQGEIDAAAEAERIESLLLDRNPELWLAYLRERAELVAQAATGDGAAGLEDLAVLAGILRDQLVLIQVTLDLEDRDLALIGRLEGIERGSPQPPAHS